MNTYPINRKKLRTDEENTIAKITFNTYIFYAVVITGGGNFDYPFSIKIHNKKSRLLLVDTKIILTLFLHVSIPQSKFDPAFLPAFLPIEFDRIQQQQGYRRHASRYSDAQPMPSVSFEFVAPVPKRAFMEPISNILYIYIIYIYIYHGAYDV